MDRSRSQRANHTCDVGGEVVKRLDFERTYAFRHPSRIDRNSLEASLMEHGGKAIELGDVTARIRQEDNCVPGTT